MYYYIQYHRTHRRVPNDLLHMQIVNHIQYKLDVDGYVASWEILRTYLPYVCFEYQYIKAGVRRLVGKEILERHFTGPIYIHTWRKFTKV